MQKIKTEDGKTYILTTYMIDRNWKRKLIKNEPLQYNTKEPIWKKINKF